MNTKHYRHTLSSIIQQRNGWMMASFAQLAIIVILIAILGLQFGRERVFLVPSNLSQKAWVSTGGFQASYIADMAERFVLDWLNVHPQITSDKHLLLSRVAPEYYNAWERSVRREIEHIKRNKIVSIFTIDKTEVDPKKLVVIVHGKTHKSVKGVDLGVKDSIWHLTFVNKNGRLLVAKLEELSNE